MINIASAAEGDGAEENDAEKNAQAVAPTFRELLSVTVYSALFFV